MACYNIRLKNREDFIELIRSRDPEMVISMVNCVLRAIESKKKKVDIIQVKFDTGEGMMISASQEDYKNLLEKCKEDLIELEEFELCAEIQKAL